MRTSARTGLALTAAGLATSGITMLSGGAAHAATMPDQYTGGVAGGICTYQVRPKQGANVRTGPGVKFRKVKPALKQGTRFRADCKDKGWTQIRSGLPKKYIGKWIARSTLTRIRPHGGVHTGGGGMSTEASTPALATAGIGIGTIVLGGGVALVSRRRRAEGQS